jgi:hypothetical protein
MRTTIGDQGTRQARRQEAQSECALYVAAGGAAAIAAMFDLAMNGEASASYKLGNRLFPFLLNYQAITAALLVAIVGAFYCWVDPPKTRKDAFGRGLSVLTLTAIAVPNNIAPPGVKELGAGQLLPRDLLAVSMASLRQPTEPMGRAVVTLVVDSQDLQSFEALIRVLDGSTGSAIGSQPIRGNRFEVTQLPGPYFVEVEAQGYQRIRLPLDIQAEPRAYQVPLTPSSVPLQVQRLYPPKVVAPVSAGWGDSGPFAGTLQ